MALEIQQSINQILSSASGFASIGKMIHNQREANKIQQESFQAQEREREYNKPENVKARRIEELNAQAKQSVATWNDRVNSLTQEGYTPEQAEAIATKDLDKELSIYEELYDLGEKEAMKKNAETYNQAQVAKEQWTEKQEKIKQSQNDAIQQGLEKLERDQKTQSFISMVMEGTTPSPKAREVIKYGN